jgi:hypothetical protein
MSKNECDCLSMQKGCVVERICTVMYVLCFECILKRVEKFRKYELQYRSCWDDLKCATCVKHGFIRYGKREF